MSNLIDKDAVVAEIKRIEHETNYEAFTDEVLGKRYVCKCLLSFLDSLEVKEVDLEKEYKDFIKSDNGRSMFETAKYFFELGIKVQKGE